MALPKRVLTRGFLTDAPSVNKPRGFDSDRSFVTVRLNQLREG